MNATKETNTALDTRAVAEEAAHALYAKKGEGLRLFRVEDTTVIADYFVICSGRASTHLRALADEVEYKLGLKGIRTLRVEGREGGEWLLVDLGTVIVHIFSRDAREYYNLERLLSAESELDLTALTEEWNKIAETGEKDI